MWDVGGQDKLRPLWRSYTRCTDGIIFVIDSCKEERLEEAKLEMLRFCKCSSNGSKNNASAIPLLVLANKQDLPSALEVTKLETLLGLKELGPNVPWHLQPSCAVTGEGLEEGMKILHEMIVRKRKASKNMPAMNGLSKTASNRKLHRSHSHVY